MLVKYAGPYLEGADSHEQRQSWLNIACTAWNIAVLPHHERKRALSRYLVDVVAGKLLTGGNRLTVKLPKEHLYPRQWEDWLALA